MIVFLVPLLLAGAKGDAAWAKGKTLLQQKRYEEAIEPLEQALDAKPDSEAISKALANAACGAADDRYLKGDRDEALAYAQQAIDVEDLACGHFFKGQILFDRGQEGDAAMELRKAKELDPKIKGIDKLLARASKDSTVVTTDRASNAHFLAELVGDAKPGTLAKVLDRMESARSKVYGALGAAVDDRITLQVYSGAAYASQSGAPEWSGGMFDGKIRVLLATDDPASEEISTRLVHEYSHAVVRTLSHGHAPAWLDEGIAMILEGKEPGSRSEISMAKRAGRLKPLSELVEGFTGMNGDDATAAYEESWLATQKLQSDFGKPRMIAFVRALGQGQDLAPAFQGTFGKSLATFEKDFRDRL